MFFITKIVFIFFLAFNGKVLSEENNKTIQNNKISVFAGVFDYRRDSQNSFMYGFLLDLSEILFNIIENEDEVFLQKFT